MKRSREDTKNRSFSLVVASVAIATVCFGVATPGVAAFRRVTAFTECRAMNGSLGQEETITSEFNDLVAFELQMFFGTSDEALCPIPSDGYLPHQNINLIKVTGIQRGTSDVDLRVCSQDYASYSFDCGSFTDVGSGTIHFDKSIADLSPLQDHAFWFPALIVEGMLAGSSGVRGIYITD